MVQMVTMDNPSMMNHLLYPEQNPMNFQFLQNQFTQLSHTLGEVGQQFVDKARAAFEAVQQSDIITKAKMAVQACSRLFHPNTILPLQTLEDLQFAQPIMQRYIMAMPEYRTLFHEQRCSGYVDTYVDVEPGRVGWDHYDYRRVMDGIVTYNDPKDDEEPRYDCYEVIEVLREGDKHLDIFQQGYILSTHELAKAWMEAGIDIGDVEGGKLP